MTEGSGYTIQKFATFAAGKFPCEWILLIVGGNKYSYNQTWENEVKKCI